MAVDVGEIRDELRELKYAVERTEERVRDLDREVAELPEDPEPPSYLEKEAAHLMGAVPGEAGLKGFGGPRRENETSLADKTCQSIEWWTPEKILVAVRKFFALRGRHDGFDGAEVIELDPATDASNPTKALDFFTKETNGLAQSWSLYECCKTNVFVNPPYGREIRDWARKIHAEAIGGQRIVALLPGQRFEQRYWQENLFNERLVALVFIVGRLSFKRPDGTACKGNPYGSFLYVYDQPGTGAFGHAVEAFSHLGMVFPVDGSAIVQCAKPAKPARAARAAA